MIEIPHILVIQMNDNEVRLWFQIDVFKSGT